MMKTSKENVRDQCRLRPSLRFFALRLFTDIFVWPRAGGTSRSFGIITCPKLCLYCTHQTANQSMSYTVSDPGSWISMSSPWQPLRGSSEPISLGTLMPKGLGSDPLPTQKQASGPAPSQCRLGMQKVLASRMLMLSERRPWASLLNSGRTLGFGTSRLGGMKTSPKSTWKRQGRFQINCWFDALKVITLKFIHCRGFKFFVMQKKRRVA